MSTQKQAAEREREYRKSAEGQAAQLRGNLIAVRNTAHMCAVRTGPGEDRENPWAHRSFAEIVAYIDTALAAEYKP